MPFELNTPARHRSTFRPPVPEPGGTTSTDGDEGARPASAKPRRRGRLRRLSSAGPANVGPQGGAGAAEPREGSTPAPIAGDEGAPAVEASYLDAAPPARRRSTLVMVSHATEPVDPQVPEDASAATGAPATAAPRASQVPRASPAPRGGAGSPTDDPIRPAGPADAARHRAEPRGNRRNPRGTVRRITAITGITAMFGVSALGAVAAESDPDSVVERTLADAAANDSLRGASAGDASAAPETRRDPVVTSGLSTTQAPFTGGTQVTVQGEHLDQVASVVVGGVAASIVSVAPDTLTFAVPAAAPEARGPVDVAFADAAGDPVEVGLPSSSSPASIPGLDAPDVSVGLRLEYTSDPRIDAQVNYLLAYWQAYNGQFAAISGSDCANFASQSLLQRGWAMDAAWWYDFGTGQSSPAWKSSTAMRDWLNSRPDLATPLEDSQRDQVKVGDVAQFDWDGSGDRDHTAVVTRVDHTAAGTKVWVAGHTKDADYWDVDQALATGGGSVHYFSLR
ncbi:amidase domain-containing protein [Agromyces sp. MMS24-JH15]|uniref:amidase domain-containing protein n=1 Tax=Agromyces sp. MMS24-JH15 TaxID=3243765 RepID=UPI0037486535